MKEYAGRLFKVDLDGPDGCAAIDVRVLVPVQEARKLAPLMLRSDCPLRVHVPDPSPSEREGEST